MASRLPSRRPAPRPTPRRPLAKYKVYLHRAADHGLMAVARAVVDLTRYAAAEAEFRMWEAHHRGRAVVVVTHLERAELYVEQFADRGLRATIEPV